MFREFQVLFGEGVLVPTGAPLKLLLANIAGKEVVCYDLGGGFCELRLVLDGTDT